MGDYTTAIDVRKLFKKLDTTDLTNEDIEFYIVQAEAELNGKLASRYDLPFDSTPPLVKAIATELALVKILDRYFTGETKSKSDWREIRKKDVNDLIDKIVSGEIPLIDSSGNIIAQRSDIQDIYSDTQDYTPTFSHLHYTRWKIDSDRLDDEEDNLD